MTWISKCHYELVNLVERQKKPTLTSKDVHELKYLMKACNIDERHAEEGLVLCNECKDLYEYLKETISLNKLLKSSKPIFKDDEIDNCSNVFKKASQLHETNKNFRNNVVMCLLKSIVVKQSSGHNNLAMESKLVDFFRYLRTLSTQSCKFVASNLGTSGRAISDRWSRELNRRDRSENIFKCEVKDVHRNMKQMIDGVSCKGQTVTFSIAIDGTKAPRSMNINAAHKCIMGRCYPHHIIDTTNLSKEEINEIMNARHEDLAAEIKVATICLQNAEKGCTPMSIVAARPQGMNEVSMLTDDFCKAATMIAKENKRVCFTNFATDRVSVETNDIMKPLFLFLDGKVQHAAGVDNKHNAKNHRYQHVGGSNVATIGNYDIVTFMFVSNQPNFLTHTCIIKQQ